MTRFRVRRGAVVAVLLVLAFGVAAALAVQAYRTAGDHRAQADRVLRDYARLAAARVAIRTATDIYYTVSPAQSIAACPRDGAAQGASEAQGSALRHDGARVLHCAVYPVHVLDGSEEQAPTDLRAGAATARP